MNRIFALTLFAAVTGCSDVPDSPTWTEDVRPILVANCVRCHAPPYIGGAPQAFRLDIYDNLALADGPDANEDLDVVVVGANGEFVASYVAERVRKREMPPRYELSDRQIEIIGRWADSDAPHGDPRPDNALPTMELTADLVEETDRVAIRYQIDDADFDLVTSIICATDDPDYDPVAPIQCTQLDNPQATGLPIFVTDSAISGFGQVTWNTRQFAPGNYRLIAELDDGQEKIAFELGRVEVQP